MPPVPELSGSRLALVIGTATYTDPGFSQLRAPAQDVADMVEVLADPAIGGFKVTQVLDRPEYEIRRAIGVFLADRRVDDLVVVYLSCHGVLDARGRLYFAAADTVKSQLSATGVGSAWLRDQLEECRARQKVWILDCCYSGSFDHTKGDTDLELERRLGGSGRGFAVLTASRAGEYSYEGTPLPGALSRSVFTAGLVDGLRSGDADRDGDGYITVEDAYDYAADQVKILGGAQTPQRWLYGAEGAILLSRNPHGATPAALPEALKLSLDSPYPNVRLGAVATLGTWLTSTDPGRVQAAEQALQRVASHDSPTVAAAARDLLHQTNPPIPPGSERVGDPPHRYQEATSQERAFPVSTLLLSVLHGEHGSRISIKWRQPADAEVTVRRASEPCAWEFGAMVPFVELSGYGQEVPGIAVDEGEWRTLTADVPTGRFWYVPFTLGPSGAVRGQDKELGIASPITGLRYRRLGPEVVLSWTWPERIGTAEISWRTRTDSGRLRLTRQQYQDMGGCRIRSGTAGVQVQVQSVVASERGEWMSVAVDCVVPESPPVVSYTIELTRRLLIGSATVRVRLTADQPVGRVVVLVVVAPGPLMPRRPTDGQVLLRSPQELGAGHEVEFVAAIPRLRKAYWVRCFLEENGGGYVDVQLIDPPIKQLRVS